MLGSKEEPYPGRVLISFWCDYDNKNLSFLRFRIYLIFKFRSFGLLSKFGNIVIQLKCYILDMLTGPKKVARITSFFLFSSTKFKMADESHVKTHCTM